MQQNQKLKNVLKLRTKKKEKKGKNKSYCHRTTIF